MSIQETINKKSFNLKKFLLANLIPIFFGFIIIIGSLMTDKALYSILDQIVQESIGNIFIVLSLLIPILVGIGFNFGIIIGAMAGHFGILIAINWGFSGLPAFLMAILLATPIAIILGLFLGLLVNRAKGREMITSIFVGYTFNGIYQLIALFLIGGLIPFSMSNLLVRDGIGLKNTIDLIPSLGGALDGLLRISLIDFIILIAFIYFLYVVYKIKKEGNTDQVIIKVLVPSLILIISLFIKYTNILLVSGNVLREIQVPFVTVFVSGTLAFFISRLTHSKTGEILKKIKDKPELAKTSGLPVNKYKLMAVIVSIVLAAWGQIIYLQSSGVLFVYGSHLGLRLLPIISLIVGGATIKKATVTQAIIGVLLVESFLFLAQEIFIAMDIRNIYEVLRMILFNGLLVYAFIQSSNKKLN